jgi:TM2 domain-containing membrane protein YozV
MVFQKNIEGRRVKVLAIIINIFFPGIGTMIIGKVGTGVIQLVLSIIAVALSATGVLSIVGIPLGIGVWIWALVSVASSNATETVIVKEVVREVPVDNKGE